MATNIDKALYQQPVSQLARVIQRKKVLMTT